MHSKFVIGLIVVAAGRASGQSTPASDAPQCLGFSFGAWSPALDWKGAGHGQNPDSSVLQSAPRGRDWGANALGRETDSSVVLFPAWWPVGVVIEFDRR